MDPKILIIGASGFIGSNLLRAFEEEKIPVKAMSRNPNNLLVGSDTTTPVQGDLEDKESLEKAMEGTETVYYLAHSLDQNGVEFMEMEKFQAHNLAELLTENHKLIYLGGFAPDMELSPHLESRRAVGDVFRKTKAKTVEFRASIVIGRGSASFEMIRALVNRLPFIVTAGWADSLCQPIAIKDVVSYLVQAKDKKLRKKHSVFEIGGSQKLRYHDLLTLYAKEEGLSRPGLHIKNLPVSVAKDVMKIVVPEYYEVGSKLLESIQTNTVAENEEALKVFKFQPISYTEAVQLAKDPELKETNFAEVLKKLKAHPEIPRYLAGQTLQRRFELPENGKFIELVNSISQALPFKFNRPEFGGEYFVKVPFVGEIKLLANDEDKYLLLAYKPKYFFQGAGWALFDKVAREAQKRLKAR